MIGLQKSLTDFEINANGTLNLLDLTLKNSPKAKFIFMSTNKVYGDKINTLKFLETKLRFTPKIIRLIKNLGLRIDEY